MTLYKDRKHAGQELAEALERFRGDSTVVLALPRGGIVPGAEVAKLLKAPLGVVMVRKIGHPANPEYAIGAVVEGEPAIFNEAEKAFLDDSWLKQAEKEARALMARRRKLYYNDGFTPPEIAGKTVILVDDGIATGLTMEAATRAARDQGAKRVIVASPVAPNDSAEILNDIADEVIVLDSPEEFRGAVASHYLEFGEVDDQEVRRLLQDTDDYLTRYEEVEFLKREEQAMPLEVVSSPQD